MPEIAERLGVSRPTATRLHSQGHLGEPAATRPYRYAETTVVNVGRERGYLDEEGQPRKGRTRRGVPSLPDEPVINDGRTLMYTRHVSHMFGVREQTVSMWRYKTREVMPDPDGWDGKRPYWYESTLRRWGRETGRLDEKGHPRRAG